MAGEVWRHECLTNAAYAGIGAKNNRLEKMCADVQMQCDVRELLAKEAVSEKTPYLYMCDS